MGDNQGAAPLGGYEPPTTHHNEVTLAMTCSEPNRTRPTSIYKYFDARGILIYVGLTGQGVTRNRQHNSDKAWWPFVASQDVEHFDTRAEAQGREIALIHQFRPPFNIVHNADYRELRRAYLDMQDGPAALDVLQTKQLVSTGEKRWIRLGILTNGHDAVFVTLPDDAYVGQQLKDKGCRVLVNQGTKIGTVQKIQKTPVGARIVTSTVLPGRKRIVSARAKLRFVSMRAPLVIELAYISVGLD
jgi:hypothetical protein